MKLNTQFLFEFNFQTNKTLWSNKWNAVQANPLDSVWLSLATELDWTQSHGLCLVSKVSLTKVVWYVVWLPTWLPYISSSFFTNLTKNEMFDWVQLYNFFFAFVNWTWIEFIRVGFSSIILKCSLIRFDWLCWTYNLVKHSSPSSI